MVATKTRRYTRDDWADFAHTGPGTLAGRFMRMFWQPVYRSQDLDTGYTKPLMIMSEEFTLYRGKSGTAYAVAFRCAHRGTQLSVGKVEGENIRCFYHGWMYDGSGQCVEQPAEPNPFCQKIQIRSYPLIEYLGLIWIYMGEGEPPSLRRYSEFDRQETNVVIYPPAACNFFNRMENAVDQSHVQFVHFTTNLSGVPHVVAKETSYGLRVKGVYEGLENVGSGAHYQIPNASQFKTGNIEKIAFRVPIDDEHHISFNVEPSSKVRTGEIIDAPEMGEKILAGDLRIWDMKDFNNLFELQDYVAQVGQGVIAPRENDHLGATDVGVALMRKIWARELRALAEGKPLKQWTRPDRMTYANEPGWDDVE